METLQQAAAAAAAAAAVSNGGTPGSGEGGQEARGNNAADSNRAALDVALLRAELQVGDSGGHGNAWQVAFLRTQAEYLSCIGSPYGIK
eukprot:804980-Pelagomonas_calceolata.AAC.3